MGVYAPTTWTTTTGINIGRLNNLEAQYADASACLPPGVFSAFVQSGLAASKDGPTVNQLDVTSGVAWLQQSDNTVQRIATAASTAGQFTTATPSTTYYLFLLNTGAWQWGTSSTQPSNSLAIAQVTTDSSGNISAVTDERTLNTTLLSGMSASLTLPPLASLTVVGHLHPNSGLYSPNDSWCMSLNNGGSVTINGTAFGSAWQGTGTFSSDNGKLTTDGNGNLSGVAGTTLPTTRNGTATSVPIFTGTNTPTGTIPTGAIWIDG